MTNGEKYKDEILRCDDLCEFVRKKVLAWNVTERDPCGVSCRRCKSLMAIWLLEQYIEPPICWEDVAIDTPILVSDTETDGWVRRHFAKIENGVVYAWDEGKTSFTAKAHECTGWYHARLAEETGR